MLAVLDFFCSPGKVGKGLLMGFNKLTDALSKDDGKKIANGKK
jgi:hypothetical protein